MNAILKNCQQHGLTFIKGKKDALHKIITRIGDKDYVWDCKTLKECKEAIFQAECLKKWAKIGA